MSLTRTPITADLVRGALELEGTDHGLLPHRLPAWARAEIPADGQLAMMEAQPSGVRLAFRTRASVIELEVLPTKLEYPGAPPRPDGVYDLVVDGLLVAQATASGGNVRTVDMMTGSTSTRPGPTATIGFHDLADVAKDVEIWLPHNEATELVGLRTDAPVEAASSRRRVWLHHGSSISHGSNADHPTGTWPALAASAGDVELVNLGFGGSALLDPVVAQVMRDLPADLISLKLGINLVNTDLMSLGELAPAVHVYLDTIREGHPTTPLLVVSSVLCPIHEHTPGPAVPDLTDFAAGRLRYQASGDPDDPTRLTLTRIRAELARICTERSATDPHLHYLDGRELYGERDVAEHPLPDDLHPDLATHRLIGQQFAERVFTTGGTGPPWATPSPGARRTR